MCIPSVLTNISQNIMSGFLLLYHCRVKICFLDLNVFLDQLQSYSNTITLLRNSDVLFAWACEFLTKHGDHALFLQIHFWMVKNTVQMC